MSNIQRVILFLPTINLNPRNIPLFPIDADRMDSDARKQILPHWDAGELPAADLIVGFPNPDEVRKINDPLDVYRNIIALNDGGTIAFRRCPDFDGGACLADEDVTPVVVSSHEWNTSKRAYIIPDSSYKYYTDTHSAHTIRTGLKINNVDVHHAENVLLIVGAWTGHDRHA